MFRTFTTLFIAIVLFALLMRVSATPDREAKTSATTQAAWPIQYRVDVIAQPSPQHVHILTIDLTDHRVHVRVRPGGPDPDGAGPWSTSLQTVREIAARDGLDAAVNGNFFASKDVRYLAGRKIPYFTGNWAMAIGWAMTDGRQWGSVQSYGADGPSLVIDDVGHASIDQFAKLPATARQVATGMEWLVKDGVNSGHNGDVAPRTAAALDRSANKLFLVVVDGRRDGYSVGMSAGQLGDYLVRLGCWRAILLDGGGSATMVLRDSPQAELRLKNRPSDGHDLPISMSFERAVDDAVGVSVDR